MQKLWSVPESVYNSYDEEIEKIRNDAEISYTLGCIFEPYKNIWKEWAALKDINDSALEFEAYLRTKYPQITKQVTEVLNTKYDGSTSTEVIDCCHHFLRDHLPLTLKLTSANYYENVNR